MTEENLTDEQKEIHRLKVDNAWLENQVRVLKDFATAIKNSKHDELLSNHAHLALCAVFEFEMRRR